MKAFTLATLSCVTVCAPLLTAGCATGSKQAIDSKLFVSPPEIRLTGKQYRLLVFEKPLEPVTVGSVAVRPVGDELHVYADVMISRNGFTRSPRVFRLRIPNRFRGRDLSNRFLWRNPDGTLHPLDVRTDATAALSADAGGSLFLTLCKVIAARNDP